MSDLELRLQRQFEESGIIPQEQKYISDKLAQLATYHLPTYEHSVRVGLGAAAIAGFMHLDQKPAIYGVLHDIGKLDIPLETLTKTASFTPADMDIMKEHTTAGLARLADHPFCAQLALRHHQYQRTPYPTTLPKPPVPFGRQSMNLVELYSRIVSLADVYDALHRKNDKYGVLNCTQIKEKMLEQNSDQKYLINQLYRCGVLV